MILNVTSMPTGQLANNMTNSSVSSASPLSFLITNYPAMSAFLMFVPLRPMRRRHDPISAKMKGVW